MEKWYGIDVSDNQGVIDWNQVKGAGCQFAILRSVRRSGKQDHQFSNNLVGCRANGIPVSVYKYTYATTEAAAREEALQVVNLLKAHGLNCVVWWDIEDRCTLSGVGKVRLTKAVQAARDVVENVGLQFGIYTGKYPIKEGWFDYAEFLDCLWWCARYPLKGSGHGLKDVPEGKEPEVPMVLDGWQWTSRGSIAGISENVDMDIMYQEPEKVLETKSEVEFFPEPKIYKNGSTPEAVYSSTAANQVIGNLFPGEECQCIGACDNMACVVYDVTGSGAKKTGWVKWMDGIQN